MGTDMQPAQTDLEYWQAEARKYVDYLAQIVDDMTNYPSASVFTQYPAMSRPITRAKCLVHALEQLEMHLSYNERED